MAHSSRSHFVIAGLVLLHQLISMFWYSPFLFGYHWINASGFRLSQLPPYNETAFYWPFVFSVIASVLLCYAMTFLYVRFKVTGAAAGVKWGFVIWFVFVFLNLLTHNQFAQRPVSLSLIDGGRDFIIFTLSGLVISTLIVRKNI